MARPLRIQYAGAWYHVMNRGRRGENIFTQPGDNELFIALLQETSEMFDLRVSAYCLMSNHYHLLVQTPSANLSRAMRHINGVYTQRFNRSKKIDGQLFRGRYRNVLVEEDSHLLELLRYIHRNPVRANICTTVNSYRWSSHKAYIANRTDGNWLHTDFLLSLFAENSSRARRLYKTFVSDSDSTDILDFYGKKKLSPFFGSSDFVRRIKEKYRNTNENPEIPESRQLAPSVVEIKKTICEIYGVTEQSLEKGVRGQTNEPRNIAIYVSRKRSGLPLHEIGKEFGVSTYSSVSSVVCRTEQQLARDNAFRIQLKNILHKLNMSQAET